MEGDPERRLQEKRLCGTKTNRVATMIRDEEKKLHFAGIERRPTK